MAKRLLILMVLAVAACGDGRAAPPATTEAEPEVTTTVATPTTMPAPDQVEPVIGLAVAAPAPEPPRRLVIHGAGDVNFALNHNAIFREAGYGIAWTGLDGIFANDDLTIVNLECSPTEKGFPVPKKWAFRCPLESLGPMLDAGVEVTSMANNHAGDMGRNALVDARRNLVAAGFAPVGAGENLAEANRPFVTELGGHRIAVVGLSTISGEVPGWFASEQGPGVASGYGGNHVAAVEAAAELADIVIVTIHWGEGGYSQPTAGDRTRATEMIEAGADVILGHHSHRLQPLEIIDGVPVFWSLGNFVWPDLGPIQSTTGIAEVIISPDGSITARLIPAYIASHGHPELRGSPDYTLRTDLEQAD